MSSKSANYCCPSISGGQALLLLCEAELGNPMQVLTNAQYDAGTTAAQQGMISTFGQGLTAPKGFKDAGGLHDSLAGVQMVRRLRLLGRAFTDNVPARHNTPARRYQRQQRILDVQRIHLLQRSPGALEVPSACQDVSWRRSCYRCWKLYKKRKHLRRSPSQYRCVYQQRLLSQLSEQMARFGEQQGTQNK